MLPVQIVRPIQGVNIKTDDALTHEINRAFKTENILRALDYFEIDVQMENRSAYIYGYTANRVTQGRIECLIRTVPGVEEISSNLVLDDDLAREIAASLVTLEQKYDCKLFIGSSHGVVSINGVVHSEDIRLLAEQCAALNSKVRGVINNIRLSGVGLVVQDEPFLQPVIGETILFLDGISAVVIKVVINPNNRRVQQMIVDGEFPIDRQYQNPHISYKPKMLKKSVVIPMALIRHLSNNSGFLKIKSTETTQYAEFDPLYFISPERGWVPPYPYFHEDIIFYNQDRGNKELDHD